ncbi:disintegrin and metalloproteinase domain-containing protein 10 [Ixodes scapularis]
MVIVDHVLYNYYRRNSDDASAKAYLTNIVASHVNTATTIYSSTDFGGIVGIKFIVQSLKINSTSCEPPEASQNPFCSDDIDASVMLQLLSFENHNDFCLTYVLTNRDFSFGTLGLAYLAYPDDPAHVLKNIRGQFINSTVFSLGDETVARHQLPTSDVKLELRKPVPNAYDMKYALKLVCVSQFLHTPSSTSYEQDDSVYLMAHGTKHAAEDTDPLQDVENSFVESLTMEEEDILFYVGGFILKRMAKTIEGCSRCKSALLGKNDSRYAGLTLYRVCAKVVATFSTQHTR